MARRARRRKKLTQTQKYERLQTGLRYFGIELKSYQKVNSKTLRKAEKIYQDLRKQLRKEGITDLPNIIQLAKEVRRREEEQLTPTPIPQAETREPLPYAETNEAPYIDFSSAILDDFMETLNEAMSDAAAMYGLIPPIWHTMSEQHARILETFNQLKREMGEENLAQFLESSLEYDKLRTLTKVSYSEAVEILDNILDDLNGILNQAKEYNESPQEDVWIAPTNIILG